MTDRGRERDTYKEQRGDTNILEIKIKKSDKPFGAVEKTKIIVIKMFGFSIFA